MWTQPLRANAGLALAAVAAVMLVGRLPGAYHELQHAAKAAAGRNELGGALAAADSLGLNDDLVRATFAEIPPRSRFAIVLPKDETAVEQRDSVAAITFAGLPPLLGNYLLPRRLVSTPVAGTYIVCFYCDAAAWSGRARWLGPAVGGGRIGYVTR